MSSLGLDNTEMVVSLNTPISTKASRRGDTFAAQIVSPEEYRSGTIEGHINSVKRAKKRNRAEILFVFETITMNGNNYLIRADLTNVANSKGVKEVDEEGRAIGKTSRKKAIGSAAAGATIGAIIGAIAGGGKGAAQGAGAGAIAGLLIGITFTTASSDLEFAPGSQFTIMVSDRSRE
jgi:hypothetical protein